MKSLVAVSVLWAFSFSLIGVYLSGKVDSYLAVLIRFLLAAVVLTPFIRTKYLTKSIALKVMGIGAIQIGLMYIAFYNSFLLLSVPEVILFTIFTPIYVSLFSDMLDKKFNPIYLVGAVIAVVGAAILRWNNISSNFLMGFMLVQVANICFGIGQVLYVRLTSSFSSELKKNLSDRDLFAFFYYGAIIVAIPATLLFGNITKLPTTTAQYVVLLWLGIVASGVGYLMWNSAARYVSSGTLAVMNNLVIPLGIVVNLTLWGRDTNLLQLSSGLVVILLGLAVTKYGPERLARA